MNISINLKSKAPLFSLEKLKQNIRVVGHIEGVPGAGKTYHLIRAFIEAFEEDPKGVALLVFNRAIKEELLLRIEKLISDMTLRRQFKSLLPVYTFDKVMWNVGVSCKAYNHILLSKDVQRYLFPKNEVFLDDNLLEDFFGAIRSVDLLKYLQVMDKYPLISAIEKRITNKKMLTLEMVPLMCYEKVVSFFEDRNLLFVDEVQDLQPYMYPVLYGHDIYSAGDINQSIYNFFGARVDVPLLMQKKAKTRKYLNYTRRLPQLILREVNSVFTVDKRIQGTLNEERGLILRESSYDRLLRYLHQTSSDNLTYILTALNETKFKVLHQLSKFKILYIPHHREDLKCLMFVVNNPHKIPLSCIRYNILEEEKLLKYWVLYKNYYVLKRVLPLDTVFNKETLRNFLLDYILSSMKYTSKKPRKDLNMYASLLGREGRGPSVSYKDIFLAIKNKKVFPKVLLISTIHSTKGAEADSIFLLLDGISKSKFKQDVYTQNMLYVGMTRSKKEIYISGWDPWVQNVAITHFKKLKLGL